MNKLSNNIYQFYIDHFAELPLDKQMHFASRLWLWNNDATCHELLQKLRGQVLPHDDALAALTTIHRGTLFPMRPGSATVLAIRAPYFERYPLLRQTASTLYWANLLEAVYGADCRGAILNLFTEEQLSKLYNDLLDDKEALFALSTYAVNFLYLSRHFVDQNVDRPVLSMLATYVQHQTFYDLTNPKHVQLYLYLIAHAVIGESLFYRDSIASDKLVTLEKLLTDAEKVIENNYENVGLDNKFEFLVCCKFVGHISQLETTINKEAATSVSARGTFLVDTQNAHRGSIYTSLDKSEHRNVLFIMSNRPR